MARSKVRFDVSQAIPCQGLAERWRKRHCVVSRLNDAVANRIVYELTHGVNAQFEHNSRPMGLYGSDTDPQRRCYFLVALTPRQKLNDPPLSRGSACWQRARPTKRSPWSSECR